MPIAPVNDISFIDALRPRSRHEVQKELLSKKAAIAFFEADAMIETDRVGATFDALCHIEVDRIVFNIYDPQKDDEIYMEPDLVLRLDGFDPAVIMQYEHLRGEAKRDGDIGPNAFFVEIARTALVDQALLMLNEQGMRFTIKDKAKQCLSCIFDYWFDELIERVKVSPTTLVVRPPPASRLN